MMSAPQKIEGGGTVLRRGVRLPETSLTAAGRVSVERHLYGAVAGQGPRVCPLEVRGGIMGGNCPPRAARQAAFAMAQRTPGESEALLTERGPRQPSRSRLDRRVKALSVHGESQREGGDAAVRQADRLPSEAQIGAISVEGVMSPIRGAAQAAQPGKQASGPTGYPEVGCATVTW